MTDLSVIIVSYKGWARLTKCLESLNSFTGKNFNAEVIVVDNRSDDEGIDKIEKQFPKIRFIRNKINGGFSNGNNLGARNAKGKFLLFLNPDTVATESEIEKLLLIAEQNPDYTILSCRQVSEMGKECIVSGPFPEFHNLTGFQRAIFRNREYPAISKKSDKNQDVLFPEWISGSVVMIKMETFRRLKGFDEDFWMYFEDVDLCKRVESTGGRIVLLKNITIEHNHGGSSRTSLYITSLTKTEVHISRHIYISKHKKGLNKILIQLFLIINNLISGGFMAVLGIVFFFVPKMFARTLSYLRLISYYAGSVFRLSWVSPRSVNFHKMTIE